MKFILTLIRLWNSYRKEYKRRIRSGDENEARDFLKEYKETK